MEFKPRIVGFLCNWCSYAGADLAGVSRIQYPPNIRIVRFMCSGRMEPYFVFEAFKKKIDGILILGCHPGECHYMSGNYEAQIKFKLLFELLEFIGLQDRVELNWVSASEGKRFATVVTEFTNKIKILGPSPLRDDESSQDLLFNLKALQTVADDYRLRALVGRKRKIINEGNVYNKKISEDKFDSIETRAVFNEYQRRRTLMHLKNKPSSVKELATKLKLDSKQVLEYIVALRGKGLVDFVEIQGLTPYYISIEKET